MMKSIVKYLALVSEIIVFILIDVIFYIFASKPLTDLALYSLIIMNIGFAFTLIAPLFAPRSESNYLFASTNGFIWTGYIFIEIVLAGLFIFLFDQLVIGLTLQVVVFAIGIVLIVMELGVDTDIAKYEADTIEYREDYMSFMRDNMKEALNCASSELRPFVEKAHDRVMSMPLKKSTLEMDSIIVDITEKILDATKSNDESRVKELCSMLSDKISERNIIFRSNQKKG